MKLKTKLVIVFMVVMVFPMLFTGVMTRAFVPEKATEIQQMYLIVVSIWILRLKQKMMMRSGSFAGILRKCVFG